MFRFFRSKRQRVDASSSSSEEDPGIYELNDEEVEQLMGGAPIRHLLARPAKSGQRLVPGQHFGHLRSTHFQEAFTLQSSPAEAHWSEQTTPGQSKLVTNGGNESL